MILNALKETVSIQDNRNKKVYKIQIQYAQVFHHFQSVHQKNFEYTLGQDNGFVC